MQPQHDGSAPKGNVGLRATSLSTSLFLSSSKAGEVLGLTPSNWGHGAAEVPSTFSSVCPAFVSAAPMWSRSGVGTIVQRDEDLVDYTAGTSLLYEGFFWTSLLLDWTSTRNEESSDFNDLRL